MSNFREVIDAFFKDQENSRIKDSKKRLTIDKFCKKLQVNCEKYNFFLTTHPAKFSHPEANVSPVVAKVKGKEDGYVRSGNVSYPKDMNSGAANLPYAKFLLLTDNDGQILVEAFNANDSSVREWCKEAGQDFSTLQHSINKVLKNRKMSSTDARVKQVYFPLDRAGSEYHLLSILAPAGMVFALKDRIVNIRKNENEDLPNLTRIKYSAKPQNISYLSSKYGGSAYLLPSFPPESKKHAISLPYISSNFFRQCFNNKEIQAYLKQMHKLIIEKRNNLYVRNKLKSILHIIIDQILWQAEQIRLYEYQDWEQKYYEKLDISLRILLDNRIDPSKRDDEWQNEISEEIARAIIKAYREQEEAEMLGDEDMRWLEKEVKKSIVKI